METVASADTVDRPLLRRIVGGDQCALAELYGRYSRILLAYAVSLARDRQISEEAVQDTFLAVWRTGNAFAGRSTVRTWLFGICRRQVLGRLRGQGVAQVPLDEVLERPASEPGPEAVALARAEVSAVATAIALLPEGQREVLDLTFGARLSQAEIADLLGVPVGTVKSRLFHARAGIARALAPAVAGTGSRGAAERFEELP